MTAYASVNTAIEAMRAGAYDYMIKPLRNEDFLNRLEQLGDIIHLKSENKALRELIKNQTSKSWVMNSPVMQAVERLVLKVAQTSSTVLVTGPSGSGKGVIAELVHQNSLRNDRPFIPVNCGAIPENLLESEFFGHTKGAFTGANKAKRGFFVEADQGTIFLDEIGELPFNLQVKLLHVIEDQNVRAIGSEQPRKIDVRIIAATNKNLDKMVQEGEFREDLYFRLNVFQIPLPPLQQRKEDLPELIRHFIHKESLKMGLNGPVEIRSAAMQSLLTYNWPGNVRELQNVVARSLILSENGMINVSDLPQNIRPSEYIGDSECTICQHSLKRQLGNYELAIIKAALDDANGDRKLAAERLGIGVSSLYRKLDTSVEQ